MTVHMISYGASPTQIDQVIDWLKAQYHPGELEALGKIDQLPFRSELKLNEQMVIPAQYPLFVFWSDQETWVAIHALSESVPKVLFVWTNGDNSIVSFRGGLKQDVILFHQEDDPYFTN